MVVRNPKAGAVSGMTNKPNSVWGGARKGAGAKPAGWEPPPERLDYEAARARNEAAKADLNELELAIKRDEYVLRSSVQEATATALAALSQTLRAVPDNLERKLGVSPDVALEVGVLIDAALDDVANKFEELGHQQPDAETYE